MRLILETLRYLSLPLISTSNTTLLIITFNQWNDKFTNETKCMTIYLMSLLSLLFILSSCNHSRWNLVPAYLASYLPILVVMVANPVLYHLVSKTGRLGNNFSDNAYNFPDDAYNFPDDAYNFPDDAYSLAEIVLSNVGHVINILRYWALTLSLMYTFEETHKVLQVLSWYHLFTLVHVSCRVLKFNTCSLNILIKFSFKANTFWHDI